MKETRKAVALISGGLDSMLAAKIMLDQGIHVEGINFYTGFCVEGHTHALRNHHKKKQKRNNALWTAEQLGIKLHIIDVAEDYKEVVINPSHGYGQNLNPCLDCKIFMVNRAQAWAWMEENQFDFIITGEVVGQRPKSQLKLQMPIIAKESGSEDRLLRPLCAKLLEPTLPEREGWVDREKLFDFHGRNRTPQIALAHQFGFKDFAQPAGGCCFLTDESYSRKLKDLWQYRGEKKYELDDILMLKVGRHIRPNERFKILVGREEGENNFMEGYRKSFTAIRPLSHKGPLGLVEGKPNQNDIALAAKIISRYCKNSSENDLVTLQIEPLNGTPYVMKTPALGKDDIPQNWYL